MSWLPVFILSSTILAISASLSTRFEYKHSFKGPHLVQKDGSVPFWKHEGNAIASDDFVRLAPSLKSQRGLIWNKLATDFDNWQVEMAIKVIGRGRIGADGLAFWYTHGDEPATGRVFGSADQWNGLGIIFDSFDNDGGANNPYISAVMNDGTKSYDHHTDGTQILMGGCIRDYRNKPYPVRVRIRYESQALTVSIHTGLTSTTNDIDYEPCFRVESVNLQKGGHFSVSAATGGLADDHDVQSFLTSSLRAPEEMKRKNELEDEERKKYEDEYKQYEEQLEQAKTDYQKENPNKARHDEPDDEFMGAEQRELRMIFDGQNYIHQSIKALSTRLTDITIRLDEMKGSVGGGAGQQVGSTVDSGTRASLDELVRQGHDMTRTLQDIQNLVARMPQGQGQGGNKFQDGMKTHEISDGLKELKQEMQVLSHNVNQRRQIEQVRSAESVDCPSINCVSTTIFIALIVGQTVAFLLYMIYQSRKEAQAKKFY